MEQVCRCKVDGEEKQKSVYIYHGCAYLII